MMTNEVIQASKDMKAKTLLPVHICKICLANHAWDDPLRTLRNDEKGGILHTYACYWRENRPEIPEQHRKRLVGKITTLLIHYQKLQTIILLVFPQLSPADFFC
jgi:hypothetical protein